jgi:hypothetical protein
MMRWEASPGAGQAPPGWAEKILHAGLASGDGVLEGCDAMPGQYKKPESFCVMLGPRALRRQTASSRLWRMGARCRYPLQRPSGRFGSARSLIDSACRGWSTARDRLWVPNPSVRNSRRRYPS